MKIKDYLLRKCDGRIFDSCNQKALKRYLYASRLYHSGGFLKRVLAVKLSDRNFKKYGCNIYPSAKLGEGLYIPHFVGIVIGSTTVLGKNCTVFPNVVFGASYSPEKDNPGGRRHPECGDNCVFGANSSIIGNIKIGNNVTVGAGAVVTKDVPDNTTVVGVNKFMEKRQK